MKIVAVYSFNKGDDFIKNNYPSELKDVEDIISSLKAERFKVKVSKEKTMKGKKLYSPKHINSEIAKKLKQKAWVKKKIDLPANIPETKQAHKGYTEIDGIKNRVGLEIQLGKYAFLVYDIVNKMVIFAKKGLIRAGIEVLPMKSFAKEMSTGVGYFEYLIANLEHRGTSNIDIPVLILGIDKD